MVEFCVAKLGLDRGFQIHPWDSDCGRMDRWCSALMIMSALLQMNVYLVRVPALRIATATSGTHFR